MSSLCLCDKCYLYDMDFYFSILFRCDYHHHHPCIVLSCPVLSYPVLPCFALLYFPFFFLFYLFFSSFAFFVFRDTYAPFIRIAPIFLRPYVIFDLYPFQLPFSPTQYTAVLIFKKNRAENIIVQNFFLIFFNIF